MSLGIRGKFVVGFNGVEHRIIHNGVVVIDGKKIKPSENPMMETLTAGLRPPTSLVILESHTFMP